MKASILSILSAFVLCLPLAAMQQTPSKHDAIRLEAVVAEAFAVDLTTVTQTTGTYAALELPTWLSINANGILFGTPTSANMGDNQLFITVNNDSGEKDFNIVVSVVDAPTQVKYQWQTNVEDAFKVDLQTLETTGVSFAYVGLPSFLQGLASGTIFGIPAQSDVGDHKFTVKITNAAGTLTTITVQVTVNDPSATGMTFKEGDALSINAYNLIQAPGLYYFSNLPTWIAVGQDLVLSGVVPAGAAGTYAIPVQVVYAGVTTNYEIDFTITK